jgi:hypothetical protein
MFLGNQRCSRRRRGRRRLPCDPESSRRGRRWISALAGLIVLPVVAAAQADAPEPVVSARLLAPIPTGAAIALEPLDDGDETLRVRVRFAVGLAAQAHPVADDAPLVLRFRAVVDTFVRRPGSGLGSPRFGAAARLPPRGGPAPSGDGKVAPVRHAVRATLEQRTGGVLWEGEARGALVGNNEAALWSRLADSLVDAFGRTVERRPTAPPP